MRVPIFHAVNLAGNPTCIKADEIAAAVYVPKEEEVIIGTRSGKEYYFSSKVIKDYYNLIFQEALSDCETPDLSGVVFAIVEYELNTSKSENELNTSKRKSKPFSKDY